MGEYEDFKHKLYEGSKLVIPTSKYPHHFLTCVSQSLVNFFAQALQTSSTYGCCQCLCCHIFIAARWSHTYAANRIQPWFIPFTSGL